MEWGNDKEKNQRIDKALEEIEAGVVRYEAWQLANGLIDEHGNLTELGEEFKRKNLEELDGGETTE